MQSCMLLTITGNRTVNPEVTFDGNIHEEKNCCKGRMSLACGIIINDHDFTLLLYSYLHTT